MFADFSSSAPADFNLYLNSGTSYKFYVRAVIALLCVGCGRLDFDDRLDGKTIDVAVGSDAVAPSGLVSYWPLDEGSGNTAHDSIGNLVGDLTAGSGSKPTWTTGHAGSGVDFAGNGDRVEVATPSTVANLASLTVAAWIRPASITFTGLDACTIDKGAGNVGWVFFSSSVTNGDVGFKAYFASAPVVVATVPGVLSMNTWSHVVATWNGSALATGVHVYVDGVEPALNIAMDGVSNRLDDSAVHFAINCIAALGFTGVIDDVKVFDRVLTPAEIAAL